MKTLTQAIAIGTGLLLCTGCSPPPDEADQLAALESELERLRDKLIRATGELDRQEKNLKAIEVQSRKNAGDGGVKLEDEIDYLAVIETYRITQRAFVDSLSDPGGFDQLRKVGPPASVDTVRFSSARLDDRAGSFGGGPWRGEGKTKSLEIQRLALNYRIEEVRRAEGVSHVMVPASLSEDEAGVSIACRFVAADSERCVVNLEYRHVTRLPPALYPLPHLKSADPVPELQLPVDQHGSLSTRLNVPLDEIVFVGTIQVDPPNDPAPPDPGRELLAVFCRISKTP